MARAAHGKTPKARTRKRAPRARLEVDERRAQLVALALAAFSHRAYDEVSIDELARIAGVSKGLLYHYFPTKRALYLATLRHAARQLLDETNTDPELSADERVRRGLDTYFSFVERHGPAYVALMRGGLGSDPAVSSVLDETRSTFAARLVDGIPPGVARPLLQTTLRGWIGFVEATALDWAAHRGAVDREKLIALLSAVLFDAVARAGTLGGIGPMPPPGRRPTR
jgi:AcrR family transcriptional regulator